MKRCSVLARQLVHPPRALLLASPAPASATAALPAAAAAASCVRLIHARAGLFAGRTSRPLLSRAAAAEDGSVPFAAAEAAEAEQAAQAFPQLTPSPADVDAPTGFTKPVTRAWHLFDARDQIVGRMAGQLAKLLQGKHKPSYTPWLDGGDVVVVLNAKYLKFTGNKWSQKLYRYHTGYVGGLREIPAERWREKHPDRILRHAVAGMIKQNKLKKPRLARLKIYPGVIHPHAAQFAFDVVEAVPKLRAQRDEELRELEADKQKQQDAIELRGRKNLKMLAEVAAARGKANKGAVTVSSSKKKGDTPPGTADKPKPAEVKAPVASGEDTTLPENPEIRAAILKDREARKGKPAVML